MMLQCNGRNTSEKAIVNAVSKDERKEINVESYLTIEGKNKLYKDNIDK